MMLAQLCRKWSGSHEQMHAFATEAECAQVAPGPTEYHPRASAFQAVCVINEPVITRVP